MAWIWQRTGIGLQWPSNLKARPNYDPVEDMVRLERECEWLFGNDVWTKLDELIWQQHTYENYMTEGYDAQEADDDLKSKTLSRTHQLVFEIDTLAAPYLYVGDIKQANSRGAKRLSARRAKLLEGMKGLILTK